MSKFKEIIKAIKEYLNLLMEDISNIKFSNLKEFLINRKLLLIAMLAFFTIIGFRIGSYNSSKNIILNKLELALRENNFSVSAHIMCVIFQTNCNFPVIDAGKKAIVICKCKNWFHIFHTAAAVKGIDYRYVAAMASNNDI